MNLLKYWVIYSIFYFSDLYLKLLIDQLFLFYDYLKLAFFFLLILHNFALSSFVYDSTINLVLEIYEEKIDFALVSIEYYSKIVKEFMIAHFKFLAINFITTKIFPFLYRLIIYKPKEETTSENKKSECS